MDGLMKVLPPTVMPVMKEVMQEMNLENMFRPNPDDTDGTRPLLMDGVAACLDFVNNKWDYPADAILLASYPKTGTNWLMEVIERLVYQDQQQFQMAKAVPLPMKVLEMGTPKKYQIVSAVPLKRKVFATHCPATELDIKKMKAKNAKIVYVLRNPKDTAVSMYNFMKKLPPFQKEPLRKLVFSGWDVFYDFFMKGIFPVAEGKCTYQEHIKTWHQHRAESGVYFVFYEDMKKDFEGEVRKLANYLGVAVTDEKLAEIAGHCTIDSMRKHYSGRGGIQGQLATAFIHKGGVGGWKDYFLVAQSEEVDRVTEEQLGDTDIRFQYTI